MTSSTSLQLKADVNVASFGGNTALHLAAGQGSPTLCSMLIAAGEDTPTLAPIGQNKRTLLPSSTNLCVSPGADKHLENDEPLYFTSSSSSEDEQDEPITAQHVSPRKRPSGHTPLDLARCQKVSSM